MKKTLLAFILIILVFIDSKAQNVVKPLTQEEKQALKQKQDSDLANAYRQAGISDEQVKKIKEVEASSGLKVRKLYDERDAKNYTVVSKDTLRKFNDLLKKKKEAYSTSNPATPQTPEDKLALKKKQEEDKASAYKEIGITDAQIEKLNQIDVVFKENLNAINKEKNSSIEEIAGKDNYKKFKEIQKKQKEEEVKKLQIKN